MPIVRNTRNYCFYGLFLCATTASEISVGLFGGMCHHTYKIDPAIDCINSLLTFAEKQIENRSIDEVTNVLKQQERDGLFLSKVKNFLRPKVQQLSQKMQNARTKDIESLLTKEEIEINPKFRHGEVGILINISTNAKGENTWPRLGTHLYLSTHPGFDLYISKCDELFQVALAVGLACSFHKFQYKSINDKELSLQFDTVPIPSGFFSVAIDLYIRPDLKLHIIYKHHLRYKSGTDDSVTFGLSYITE